MAKYRQQVGAHWPGWVKSWLKTPGSLTLRLQKRGQFQVEPVFQAHAYALADEHHGLGLKGRLKVRTRNVRLLTHGDVSVLAHTVVRLRGVRCDWPFWKNLNRRSLGSMLFKDRTVFRHAMQFAQLLPGHPLHPGQGFGPLYARRRCYERRRSFISQGGTPLMVTEVFLPSLKTPPIMPPP